MKIAFCTGINLPSKTANRIHIISMVKAFVDAGHKIYFFGKSIQGFQYKNVTVINSNHKSIIIAFQQLKKIKKGGFDFIYTRESVLWFFLSMYNILFFRLEIPFVYEIHDLPASVFEKAVLRLCKKLPLYFIVITNGLKGDLVIKYNISNDKIKVLPDGVDLKLFSSTCDTTSFKKKLNLDPQKKNIVYIGHLYDWKGVHVLAEAANFLKDECNVVFVGGWEERVEQFRQKYKSRDNIHIIGHVPHGETSLYMQLADVLVLPNSGKTDISKKYTSPIKMFEYMASKRPIVASRLPSICEILTDGENVFLVEPDNPKALADGIQKALTTDTTKITVQAFQDVQGYTWEKRAQKIMELIQK